MLFKKPLRPNIGFGIARALYTSFLFFLLTYLRLSSIPHKYLNITDSIVRTINNLRRALGNYVDLSVPLIIASSSVDFSPVAVTLEKVQSINFKPSTLETLKKRTS